MSDPERVAHVRAGASPTPARTPPERHERGPAAVGGPPEAHGAGVPAAPPSPRWRWWALGAVLALAVVTVSVAAIRTSGGDEAETREEPDVAATVAPTIPPSSSGATRTSDGVATTAARSSSPPPSVEVLVGPLVADITPFELDLVTEPTGPTGPTGRTGSTDRDRTIVRVAMPAGDVLATVPAASPGFGGPVALLGAGDAVALYDDDTAEVLLVRDDGATTVLQGDALDGVVQVDGLPDTDGFWGVAVRASALGGVSIAARRIASDGTAGEPTDLTIQRGVLLPAAGGALVFGDAGGTYRFDGSATTRVSDGAPIAAGPSHLMLRVCTRQQACRFEVVPSGGGPVQRTFELPVDLIDAWLSPDGASLVGVEDSASPSGAAAEVRPPRLVHVDLTTGQVTPIASIDDFPLPTGGIRAGIVSWATEDVVVVLDGDGGVVSFDRRTGQVAPVVATTDDVIAVTTRPLDAAPAGEGEVSGTPG